MAFVKRAVDSDMITSERSFPLQLTNNSTHTEMLMKTQSDDLDVIKYATNFEKKIPQLI